MGAVMPPETENADTMEAPDVHSNGHVQKLGANFPVPGKINAMDVNGKLNGILDHEDQPVQESTPDEVATSVGEEGSSEADAEGIQEAKENQRIESASSEVEVASRELAAELDDNVVSASSEVADVGRETHDDVADVSAQWTAAEANSGWEIAENNSVLGPGPAAETKATELQPTPAKELHTYYMVRIPKPIDNKGRIDIRMAELRLKEKTEKRDFINAAFQMKKANRTEALDKLKACREKLRACGDAIRNKIEDVEPLQGALRKLRDAGRFARDKSRDLPASEQELDERIAYFEHRIQHESIPLREEKQLLRDIKNLKACREEVCANEARHAEYSESLAEREDIQDRLKPLVSELESLKAEYTIANERKNAAEAEFEKMDEALGQVQAQWTAANRARQDAFEERAMLLRQDSARNDEFYQTRREIAHVKQLAFAKDKKMVEELCNAQMERVMTLWNTNAEFRAAYVKSNERSTLKRLQTFDGRALGPDEEPPLIPGDSDDSLFDTRTAAEPLVTSASSGREERVKVKSVESTHSPVLPISDAQRNEPGRGTGLLPEQSGQVSSSKPLPSLDTISSSSGQEEQVQADLAAAAELKEKRRQQEMAKAKEAEERKKRSAERLQSKNLARAQKEAERREKEKEKKVRKKAASLSAANQGISPPVEARSGGGDLQDDEQDAEVHVQEVPPEIKRESKPGARQRKKQNIQKPKSVRAPLASSSSKKDSFYLQNLFWIIIGLVILVGIVACVAMFVS